MKLMRSRKRNRSADSNRQRQRRYELERAKDTLRNSLMFLFVTFVALVYAFIGAWTR